MIPVPGFYLDPDAYTLFYGLDRTTAQHYFTDVITHDQIC